MQKACYNTILEIACFNIESCLIAQQAGADRIEFCADYDVGGITPTRENILKVKKLLHIPLHVIIRPRGGDFNYTGSEVEQMKKDILFCKENNINGVVFGALTVRHKVDKEINKELVQLSGSMSTTFHRAIDECENLEEALNDLITISFTRVLTSGGKKNAIEGTEELKDLQKKFGKKITIIPGGGIRSNNINELFHKTECYEFHSAAFINNNDTPDENEIKKILEKIKQT